MNPVDFNKKLHEARFLMQSKRLPEALKVYSELAREFPKLGNLLEEYGRAAGAAGNYELADQLWERVVAIGPKNAALLLRLAAEYGKIWLFEKARQLSREAADLEPENLTAQVGLASLLARTSGVAEAREAVNRCLRLDRLNEPARYLAAHLDRRENKLVEAETQFRDLLASGLRDPHAIYFSHLELARVLDSMKRYDEAMAELQIAKQLTAKSLNMAEAKKGFDERRTKALEKAKALPKTILKSWAQSFPPEARCHAPTLAFLGGHARSGTTLLERILDAHPSVAAGDESMAFNTIGGLVDVMAAEIPADGLNFIRQRFLKNFWKTLGSPTEGKTLLDKNPAVTPYLPPYLRAFPELRVLIALRDPRDVLVSCYFETLTNYSHLSFENLALHYSCVMGVWLMVREWEGLAWLETRYEDIVADLEKEGGRVTKFLGLEWHENQSKFHEKNREKPIMSTTNYTNVTTPVYARSMGRWRVYEKYMEGILPVLEPFCREFGYS
ncbi:MAG TPA: sulfotransferase [Verrucomicrobiae bacterium]|nr:sulfotransferase [Verrucomicrobiae bacterium]